MKGREETLSSKGKAIKWQLLKQIGTILMKRNECFNCKAWRSGTTTVKPKNIFKRGTKSTGRLLSVSGTGSF